MCSMETENSHLDLLLSRMDAALEFIFRYHTDGEDVLNRLGTVEETWIAHVNAKIKQQSTKWGHTDLQPGRRQCV
ncbi:hypothetical protein TNCT_190611 [Trichonephila clavata]|uniref:Uncharacterized protein n=1 Tax=Trichonephila clavata TaxID=2740835 RepID=A0A8X6LTV8_TRICU|nr:hypothetical protein TNCT_190611 [Trichonephila clavata]